MTSSPVDLDSRRGMAAQKATDVRRLLADVEASGSALRERQQTLEAQMVAIPSTNWPEAAAKARYLLNLYAASLLSSDTQHKSLVAAVLADFAKLDDEAHPDV